MNLGNAAPASHYFAAQADGQGISQSPSGYCAWDGRDHSNDDPTNYSSSDYHKSVTTPDTKQPNSSTAPIRVNDPQTGVPDWFSDAFDQSMQGVDRSMLSWSSTGTYSVRVDGVAKNYNPSPLRSALDSVESVWRSDVPGIVKVEDYLRMGLFGTDPARWQQNPQPLNASDVITGFGKEMVNALLPVFGAGLSTTTLGLTGQIPLPQFTLAANDDLPRHFQTKLN